MSARPPGTPKDPGLESAMLECRRCGNIEFESAKRQDKLHTRCPVCGSQMKLVAR
jgi:ribosomal protein L37E